MSHEMETIIVPALVAVLGLLVYVLATNPKASELGRILFFDGILVALLVICHARLG